MNATWQNTKNMSRSGWDVVSILEKSYAFSDRVELIEHGIDNTRPDETRIDAERRFAARFGVKPSEMVVRIH